jgi:hypothetical protein
MTTDLYQTGHALTCAIVQHADCHSTDPTSSVEFCGFCLTACSCFQNGGAA